MKILVAPDSFKGSLTSSEVCSAIERGIGEVRPEYEVTSVPMADGGEGTAECLLNFCGGEKITESVDNIFFEKTEASFVLLADGTAAVETASASGITTVEKTRLNPLKASSVGTGELIAGAAKHGAEKIIVCLGGSATNDGGMGALYALGVRFLSENGEFLAPTGENTAKVKFVVTSGEFEKYKNIRFTLACDVENPFYGKNGAAYVFAPQKGADENGVKELDKGLENLAKAYNEFSGTDLNEVKGSGAAGGLCGGLFAMLNCEIKSGFEVLSEKIGLEEKISASSLVITGEGRTDYQTSFGKLPKKICETAKKHNVPCLLISGDISPDANIAEMGFFRAEKLKNEDMALDYALNNAYNLLVEKVREVFKGGIL